MGGTNVAPNLPQVTSDAPDTVPLSLRPQTPSDVATLANSDQALNQRPPFGPTQNLPAAQGGPGAAPPAAAMPSAQPNVTVARPNFQAGIASGLDAPMPSGSWGSRVYHGILSALGGANQTEITGYDPTTGKAIVSQQKIGPGQQWKNIVAGALTGMGASANVRGPGMGVARAGVGFAAAEQRQIEANKRNQALSQQEFENQQKAALTNANTSMLAAQTARATWDLQNDKVKASVEDMQRESEFSAMIAKGGAGSRYLGQFKTFADANADFQKERSLHGNLAQGQIALCPHINENGMVDGVQAAVVTPQWLDAKTTEDHVLRQQYWDPEKNDYVTKTQTAAAGDISNREWLQSFMSEGKDSMVAHHDELQSQELVAQTKNQLAEIPMKAAQAADAWSQVADRQADTALKNAKAANVGTEADPDVWGPGGYKTYQQWYMKAITPAQQTENSYQVAKQAYDQYKALAAQGKYFPTGAESMQLLSKHIQTTFGQVKGGKVTQAMIMEHLGARSVTDDMRVAVNKLYNNDKLSPAQWDAFFSMIKETRDQQWMSVYSDATNLQKPVTHVPIPNDLRATWGLPQQDIPGVTNKPPATQPAGGAAPPAAGAQPQRPGTPPPTAPQTHVFSKSAWAKANPGKDVNAAIAKAKAQKFTVTD